MSGEAKRSLIPDFIRFPLVLGLVCIASGASLSALYNKTRARIEQAKVRKLEAAFRELAPGYARNEAVELPAGESGTGKVFVYYRVLDEKGLLLGYGCETKGPSSYNSLDPIRAVTVIGPDLKNVRILGMRVTFSSETPGLGERIKEKPAPYSLAGKIAGSPDRTRIESKDVPVDVVRIHRRPDGAAEVVYEVNGKTERKTLKSGTFKELDFIPWFQEQFTGLGEADLRLKKDGGRIDAITGATVSSKASLGAVKRAVELLKKHAK